MGSQLFSGCVWAHNLLENLYIALQNRQYTVHMWFICCLTADRKQYCTEKRHVARVPNPPDPLMTCPYSRRGAVTAVRTGLSQTTDAAHLLLCIHACLSSPSSFAHPAGDVLQSAGKELQIGMESSTRVPHPADMMTSLGGQGGR